MGVFERAYRILDTNRTVLERCARELLARETLDENDIRQLTQGLVHDEKVVDAIQGKPTALNGVPSSSLALCKENRYVCIDSVGPLPGTG